jgi:ribA/ribD-fused uncharacterized protein
MKKACLAKFQQNDILRKELFRTGDSVLVEASPSDHTWGVGLKIDNPDVANQSKWRGKNWLGSVLMSVRETLVKEFRDEYQAEVGYTQLMRQKSAVEV